MTSPSVDLTSGILSRHPRDRVHHARPRRQSAQHAQHARNDQQARRQREQREVPEHPPVSRRPLPGARDGVQRGLHVDDQADHAVDQRHETHDSCLQRPGPLDRRQDAADRLAQQHVASAERASLGLRHHRNVAIRRREIGDGVEQLQRPEQGDENGDDREDRVVRERGGLVPSRRANRPRTDHVAMRATRVLKAAQPPSPPGRGPTRTSGTASSPRASA